MQHRVVVHQARFVARCVSIQSVCGATGRAVCVPAGARAALSPFAAATPLGSCDISSQRNALALGRSFSSVAKFVEQCADMNSARRHEALNVYRAAREETDKVLDNLVKENKLVLFLDGTVDAPRSQLSHNIVKMLTQVQAVPLVTVDIGAHAAIEGYALEKSGDPEKARCPLLFKDGAVLGGHDEVLRMFSTDQLKGSIGSDATRCTNKHYRGELPIALY